MHERYEMRLGRGALHMVAGAGDKPVGFLDFAGTEGTAVDMRQLVDTAYIICIGKHGSATAKIAVIRRRVHGSRSAHQGSGRYG